MNALAMRGVRLSFGPRVVLDGVDLSIGACGFTGVLGANGAGKTTLFRAILGLVQPSLGTIDVLGRPASRGNPAIGYMPQQRSAIGRLRLTGREFVAGVVDGHRLGMPWLREAGRREVDDALAMVGASALADRPLGATSGGERQRLLLAQALIGRPRLLLLDEPLMSLDPKHQTGVVTLIRGLQQALGMAVLFSAHELNPLLGAMDQVLYLGGGRAACGPVDEVMTGPVLSRLYNAPIDVVRVAGRIFVMAGGHDMTGADRACAAHSPDA